MADAQPADDSRPPRTFLRRVQVRNYKSIGKCDVALGALTVLVGRNGSGKSNFLDALRFVADALQTPLDRALQVHGGINEVRRRSGGHPRNFAIGLEMSLPDWSPAWYRFEIAARGEGGFVVKREHARIEDGKGAALAEYVVEEGEVRQASAQELPAAAADRLYLVNASGLPRFREVYEALVSMGFYSLNPEGMKELHGPDAGELLHRDGSNIASVVARLAADGPEAMERVRAYLGKIVPGITDVGREVLGPKETLVFRQRVAGAKDPWKFYAASMSDGTLRTLGALIAVMQLALRRTRARLIGIEEPETALHPAAAGALVDALREASAQTQVLLTSHSPDLLDQLDADSLLAVVSSGGTTRIAPVDPASRSAILGHLYTPGELLRMDQLEPDAQDLSRQEQLRLFGPAEDGK